MTMLQETTHLENFRVPRNGKIRVMHRLEWNTSGRTFIFVNGTRLIRYYTPLQKVKWFTCAGRRRQGVAGRSAGETPTRIVKNNDAEAHNPRG